MNAAAEPASSVVFTRLDSLVANDPNRFVSGIAIDPNNANHARETVRKREVALAR